jgi:hypothetical protein
MTVPVMKAMFKEHKKMSQARGGILIGGKKYGGIMVGGKIPLETVKKAFFEIDEDKPDFEKLLKIRGQFIDDMIKKAPGLKADFANDGLVSVDLENIDIGDRGHLLKKYYDLTYDNKPHSVRDFQKVASWWKRGGKIKGMIPVNYQGGELLSNIVNDDINNASDMAGAGCMSCGGCGCNCPMCDALCGGILVGGKKTKDNFDLGKRVKELEEWFKKEIKSSKHGKLNLKTIAKLAPRAWWRVIGPFLRKRVLPAVAQVFPVLEPAAKVVKGIDSLFDMAGVGMDKKKKGGAFYHDQLGITALKEADWRRMDKLIDELEAERPRTHSHPNEVLEPLRDNVRKSLRFGHETFLPQYRGGTVQTYADIINNLPKEFRDKLKKRLK